MLILTSYFSLGYSVFIYIGEELYNFYQVLVRKQKVLICQVSNTKYIDKKLMYINIYEIISVIFKIEIMYLTIIRQFEIFFILISS